MRRWLDAGSPFGQLDRRWATALHRSAERPGLLRLLAFCSRLGDGPMWLALLIVLPLAGGAAGLRQALLVAAVGSVNLVLYWALKRGTRRSRPFDVCPGIRACARVPDHFSFPSGHSLHAAAFALLLSTWYGALTPLLWGYAALVALSRVVLGLHYPSDVLVGALLGACTAAIALKLSP